MEAASSMKDLSRKPNPFVELGHRIRKHPWLYAMIVPTIVYFILFQYYPMLGIVIAFKKFTLKGGMFGGEWEGLKYFLKLFNDNTFWRVFRNTVIISTGKVLIGFPLPILIALLLNEFRSSAVKRTVQTIIYLPRFLSWVILGGILCNLFAQDGGAINQWLRTVGKEPINILSNPKNFRWTLIISDAIKGAGWGSIIYMATISGIDTDMYEAAVVDGVGRYKQIWYITLPNLLPTMSIMLILALGGIMNAGFDQVLVLYNSAVYSTGDIIDTYVYRQGLQDSKYSLSTAAGVFKSVIGCVMIYLSNLAARKCGQEGLF